MPEEMVPLPMQQSGGSPGLGKQLAQAVTSALEYIRAGQIRKGFLITLTTI